MTPRRGEGRHPRVYPTSGRPHSEHTSSARSSRSAMSGSLDARGAIIVALWGRQVTADVAVMADTILAHLPAGWALVSIEQVAQRLHERTCPERWDGTLPPGGYVCAVGDCGAPVESEPCDEHCPGPDAHLGEARRLVRA